MKQLPLSSSYFFLHFFNLDFGGFVQERERRLKKKKKGTDLKRKATFGVVFACSTRKALACGKPKTNTKHKAGLPAFFQDKNEAGAPYYILCTCMHVVLSGVKWGPGHACAAMSTGLLRLLLPLLPMLLLRLVPMLPCKLPTTQAMFAAHLSPALQEKPLSRRGASVVVMPMPTGVATSQCWHCCQPQHRLQIHEHQPSIEVCADTTLGAGGEVTHYPQLG
jgi:hypothetical protein